MESFSIVKKGYNPQEVDDYIETLEQVIKSYKDKDNAIKNAIVSAQMAADNILKNSHAEAVKYRNKALTQLRDIYDSLETQRSRVQDFQEEYNNMLRKYLPLQDDTGIELVYDRIDELENILRDISDDMDEEPEQEFTPQ